MPSSETLEPPITSVRAATAARAPCGVCRSSWAEPPPVCGTVGTFTLGTVISGTVATCVDVEPELPAAVSSPGSLLELRVTYSVIATAVTIAASAASPAVRMARLRPAGAGVCGDDGGAAQG